MIADATHQRNEGARIHATRKKHTERHIADEMKSN